MHPVCVQDGMRCGAPLSAPFTARSHIPKSHNSLVTSYERMEIARVRVGGDRQAYEGIRIHEFVFQLKTMKP